MTGSKSTNHDKSSTHTRVETSETKLLADGDQSSSRCLAWKSLALVDLGQKGVGRLRDKGGSTSSDNTSSQVESGTHGRGLLRLGLSSSLDEGLESNFKEVELGHGVWDLLEQNGSETRVESLEAFLLGNLGESTKETIGETRCRDETDTGSFQRAQGNVGKEFSDTSGSQVDSTTVVHGIVHTNLVNEDLLPEFVSGGEELQRY